MGNSVCYMNRLNSFNNAALFVCKLIRLFLLKVLVEEMKTSLISKEASPKHNPTDK